MAQLEEAPVVADEDVSGAGTKDDARPGSQQDEPNLDGDDFYEEGDGKDGKQPSADGGDEGDLDEPDLEPIAPPSSWKDEDKKIFADLPREAQEIVARRETERDSYLRTAKSEHETERQKLLTQARTELAEIHTRKAQEYQQIAAQLMPQPPDPRLLYTGNPEDQLAYQRQQAAYQSAQAQQQELQHLARTEQERAQAVAQAAEQEAAAADLKVLQGKFPDWFEGPNLKGEVISRLQPIGEALGYPKELMAQANSADFAALDTAAQWKAKADKWDALQKKRMAAVRGAKTLPNLAKPGASRGQQAPDDMVKLLYPND